MYYVLFLSLFLISIAQKSITLPYFVNTRLRRSEVVKDVLNLLKLGIPLYMLVPEIISFRNHSRSWN